MVPASRAASPEARLKVDRSRGQFAAVLFAAVGVLAQACSAAVSTDSPSGGPSSSAALPSPLPTVALTAEPSTPPPSAAPIRIDWEEVSLPDRNPLTYAAWSDADGWIVVGRAGTEGRIWRSGDGRTWTTAKVRDADGVLLSAVTRRGDEYFAAGTRCVPDGTSFGRTTGLFWRSSDAEAWDPIGSIDLGRLNDECTTIEQLAASGTGLIATLSNQKAVSSGTLHSTNGADWTPVAHEAFGLGAPIAPFRPDLVVPDPPHPVMAAICPDCPVQLWATGDGETWDSLGLVDEPGANQVSLTYGTGFVLAVEICPEEPCRTSIWASDDGTTMNRVVADLELYDPQVAYTGQTYVLAGQRLLTGGFRAFTSPDGLSWTESPTNLTEPEECRAGELAGGHGQALLITSGRCEGLWLAELD